MQLPLKMRRLSLGGTSRHSLRQSQTAPKQRESRTMSQHNQMKMARTA